MGQPVVHFEIIGNDPAKLRRYYGQLFGWEFRTGDATTGGDAAPRISQSNSALDSLVAKSSR